jgi:hypothetical protein
MQVINISIKNDNLEIHRVIASNLATENLHLDFPFMFPKNGTMWAPPVISWFISPSNYSYRYHKP